MDLRALSERFYDQMVKDRRHFHMHPEISFQEFQTANYICARLDQLGISYQYPVGENGIAAKVAGSLPDSSLAFRADIDALKLEEKNDVPYQSQNPGVMHACGHDFHTAALLAFAESVQENKDALCGEITFLFQHAEEVGPGGALGMIQGGCLHGVDKIYAAHVDAEQDIGVVSVREGFASGTNIVFRVNIQGRGGHSARPAETVDALLAACQCVSAIHTIAGRKLNPEEAAAINIGYINSGQARNIICDEASFGGMVRAYDFHICRRMMTHIETTIDGICRASGASFTIQSDDGYPAIINSAPETEMVRTAVKTYTNFALTEGEANFGGEDFSYYLHKIPGCMFKVGVRNPEKGLVFAQHHPLFDGDEQGLRCIFEVFWGIYLAENSL